MEITVNKRIKRNIYGFLTVTALVVVAFVCRLVSRSPETPLYLNKLCNIVRTLIYVGIFSVWGVSVYRRVVQVQARRFLVLLALLMVLWLILRAFKHYFALDATAERYLWYSYYIPMLFIPSLTLLVALSIGKQEGYRLPTYAFLSLVPAVALSVLTLTNDLHQCVFRFPEGSVFSESDYSYGTGYFLTVVWGVFSGGASLALMFAKNRVPKTRRILWIPVILFAVIVVYVILYASRIPFVFEIGWDLAVFECLAFAVFLESCISSGLIQSNTHYAELFRASSLSALIFDKDYDLRYSSDSSGTFGKDVLERAEKAPVAIGNELLHNMPVSGGRAIWTEDISELLSARDDLEETQAELKDRNGFLQYSYKREEENRIVEEQNRLYDLLQSKTQKQIDGIDGLVAEYGAAKTDRERKRIIAKIIILGTFIKRRKDFVLQTDNTPDLPENKLTSAFAESFRALGFNGVKGAFSVDTGKEYVSGEILTYAYDFFEDVIEVASDKAKLITVRVREVKGTLRVNITVDCEIGTEEIKNKYPDARIDADDGETELCLSLTGGAK